MFRRGERGPGVNTATLGSSDRFSLCPVWPESKPPNVPNCSPSVAIDFRSTCRKAARNSVPSRSSSSAAGRPAPARSSTSRPPRSQSIELNGRRLDPADDRRGPADAHRTGRGQRAAPGRADALLQRRRGPASARRSGRRPDLPLRDVVPRRRAALVRLLRPARSQGASTTSRCGAPTSGSCWATRRPPESADGHWQLATSQPLVDLLRHAGGGPYASVTAEHDGIPLGLHCRASLAEHLQDEADDLLSVTRPPSTPTTSCSACGIPFGEYHQVFVPDFNAGAMENPGCVTLRDQYVFRSRASTGQRVAAGGDGRPRDGPHVVRRPGHDALVGRPVAERVVRRVPGLPGVRRDGRLSGRTVLDPVRHHPQGLGRRGRPVARPPIRWPATVRPPPPRR